MRSLTCWVSPFTAFTSLDEAIARVQVLSLSVKAAPSLLLPTHFGQWPQAQCRQSIPPDMLVASPDDVGPIRSRVEAAGVGFGAWGVPVDQSGAEVAARFAEAAGYYAANFEPDVFWLAGDDPAAVDRWWTTFWDTLNLWGADTALSGNVVATVVPNRWGLDAFKTSLPNLAAGCGALALEVYGGLQTTAQYPAPNLWPRDGFVEVRARGVDANLLPILATANLSGQFGLATRLGHGNVHLWHAG